MNSNSGWGKSVIWALLVWAVLGGIIASSNQDELELSVGIFLVWPIFLFITPPGWMILFLLSRQDESSPNDFQFTSEPKKSSQNTPPPTSSLTQDSPLDSSITNSNKPVISKSEFEQESKRELANRFGWICQLCREPIVDLGLTIHDYQEPIIHLASNVGTHNPQSLAIDLIAPLAHGGSIELSNLQPVHASCKWAKGGRLVSNHHFHREIVIRKLAPELQKYQSHKGRVYSTAPIPKKTPAKYEWIDEVYSEPRLGDWVSPHRVINSLLKELERSNLSPEQEERARDFLMAEHNQDLMKNCQRGHALTLENTYFSLPADGGIQRTCRTCGRERKRQSRS